MPLLMIAAMLAAPLQLRLAETQPASPPILVSPYTAQRQVGRIMVASGGGLAAAGFLTVVTGLGVAISELCMADANNCLTPHPNLIKGLFVGGAAGIGVGAILAGAGFAVTRHAESALVKPVEDQRSPPLSP
jgi:hypothetical protein